MLWILLAGVWALIDGLLAHDVHQATNTMPPCRETGLRKISRDLAATKERILRKYPIDLVHQIKRCGIKANPLVIDR
jgi:hypothetical protein